MQWAAIFLLAVAQLGAVAASGRDPTDAAAATGTGCKHHGHQKNDRVTRRAPAPTQGPHWAVFTLDGKAYTGSAASGWFTIDGQNLQPGSKVHVRNTILRLPRDLKSLVVRHLGETSTVPVTTNTPTHTKGNKGDKDPFPTPTGEPEGKQRPGQNGGHNNDNGDDNNDCGADQSDTSSDPSHKHTKGTNSDSSGASETAYAAQTSLGGIQVTSTTPLTQDQSSPTMAPVSSSTGVAGVYSAAPWLGAAAAGFAWVLV